MTEMVSEAWSATPEELKQMMNVAILAMGSQTADEVVEISMEILGLTLVGAERIAN